MAAGYYVNLLHENLVDQHQKNILSMAIDEIERETYWETRQELLQRMVMEIEKGTVKEHVDYMLTKEKPE